jgi:hypothetical protein
MAHYHDCDQVNLGCFFAVKAPPSKFDRMLLSKKFSLYTSGGKCHKTFFVRDLRSSVLN